MSSDKAVKVKGKGCEWKRLLAKVERSIPPNTICGMKGGKRDAADPLVVQCCSSPKASVTLAFDMLRQQDGRYIVDVELRDVIAPNNMTLQFEATVESYTRPRLVDVSSATDRSTWPPPEYTKKFTLGGNGSIASIFWDILRALTVHLEVYAVGGAPYMGNLPGSLNALRREKFLTDVELQVDGEIFPAHRTVLAANSPAFRSMFNSNLKEAREGVVNIEGASSTAFGVFLEFLYTADVDDFKDCEMEVLELADRYLVDHIKAVCENHLLSSPHLALIVLQEAAKPVISSELRADAVRVVVEGFDAVSKTPQWKDFEASNPVAADSIRFAKKTSNLST